MHTYFSKNFPIWRETEQLVIEMNKARESFARQHKYTLGQELHLHATQSLTLVTIAISEPDERIESLKELHKEMIKIKLKIQLGKSLHAFHSFKQFEILARLSVSVSKQTRAWLKNMQCHELIPFFQFDMKKIKLKPLWYNQDAQSFAHQWYFFSRYQKTIFLFMQFGYNFVMRQNNFDQFKQFDRLNSTPFNILPQLVQIFLKYLHQTLAELEKKQQSYSVIAEHGYVHHRLKQRYCHLIFNPTL